MPNAVINELRRAIRGLSYMSESDSPLHVVTWKNREGPITAEKVLELSKSAPGTKIVEVPLDAVFSTQTQRYEGQGDEERDRVERFKGLRTLVTERLTHVRAYRLGEVNVRYYVVGSTDRGECAGIWTEAVET